jgi:hypothetical protein
MTGTLRNDRSCEADGKIPIPPIYPIDLTKQTVRPFSQILRISYTWQSISGALRGAAIAALWTVIAAPVCGGATG